MFHICQLISSYLHNSGLQNVTDLSDLATSGRDRNAEEEAFAEELAVKSLGFRAGRYKVLSVICSVQPIMAKMDILQEI